MAQQSSEQPALGIDLGTTNSAVAVVNEHGKAEIVPNREGERTTPSVLLFDGEQPIVGTIAKRSAISAPNDVVQFVKRQMGDPNWKFMTSSGTEWVPEQLSAAILKRLKEDAEHELGASLTQAVITVPAYFGDAQRKATQDAGAIAGLEVLRVLNEPTAAALAFGAEAEGEGTLLVYDLGGGTFDVTLMRIEGDELTVVATDGDRNLGGFDWDGALMGWLSDEFMAVGGGDLTDDPVSDQDLRDKAELAKHTLSTREQASVVLAAAGRTHQMTIQRKKFEELTSDLLRRTEVLLTGVVEDSGLRWQEVDRVLLVGGSTRMPAVQKLVEQTAGRTPERGVNPDEIVALGAARYAAAQAETAVAVSSGPARVNDVNSHSMGVIALNEERRERNSIVLERNQQIPCQASQLYSTVFENQTEIRVVVTEGEDEDPDYVAIVGEAVMKIPPHPKSSPIQVTFSYDDDGIVHVAVKDLVDGQELGEILIERMANLSDQQIASGRAGLAVTEVG